MPQSRSATRPPTPSYRRTTTTPATTVAFAAGAMFVSYLPFSAVNGALGAVRVATGADTQALQWVTDAFTVALTGAVLSGGTLADRLGRRRGTQLGLAATVLGCLVGTLTGHSVHVLQVSLAVAGIGAGLVMSASLGLIASTAPSTTDRTRGIGVWAAANVAGLGAGPFLAAAVVGAGGADAWRWLFVPVIALAAGVAAYGARRSLEVSAARATTPDRLGQLVLTATAVALVYAAIRGGDDGWTAPGTSGALAVAVALLVGAIVVERRATDPVLPPGLFSARGFLAAGLAAAAVLFTMISIVFVLSVGLSQQQESTFDIAQRLGCLFAGNALASVWAGRLQRRLGARAVLVGGLTVTALGLVALLEADLGSHLSVLDLGWRLAIVGAGSGAVIATSTAVAIASVPPALAGSAGTANNVLRQLGGALGTAVVGGVLAARLRDGSDLTAAVHTCVALLLAVIVTVALAVTALLASRETT